MTALTVDTPRGISGSIRRGVPLEASANPYAGSALSLASTGYAHELVAGERFAGFMVERTGTPAASGTISAEVDAGEFQAVLPISGIAMTDVGRRVYATDDATFSLTQAAASTYIGRVIGYESSGYALVMCKTADAEPRIVHTMAAAGTAVTLTATRTVSTSMTIKPGTLKVGSRIRARCQVNATAAVSTDTLIVDLGLAGGAWVASAATNATTADIVTVELDLVVRSLGGSGTLMGTGRSSTCAASGTATLLERPIVETTLDLTADIVLGCYLTWSTTDANSALCNLFVVEIDP